MKKLCKGLCTWLGEKDLPYCCACLPGVTICGTYNVFLRLANLPTKKLSRFSQYTVVALKKTEKR